ncbi:HAD family hydrolase [Halobacteriales archaeon Cl-PHB]
MSPESELEAVVFDLDNTLCVPNRSGEEVHEEIWETADVDRFFDLDDLREVDRTKLPTAESDREFYTYIYRAIAENVDGDPGHADHLAAVTMEVLDPTDVSPRDGALDAVDYASDHYEVAVVTNGEDAIQRQKLDAIGLDDAFETVVCCDPANGVEPKPDPTPLENALDAVGVAPDAAINVGDHHEYDVVGAHNAGMHSAWVPMEEVESPISPDPTYRLDSMDELMGIL